MNPFKKSCFISAAIALGLGSLLLFQKSKHERPPYRLLPYPDGKLYALSIVDDADWGTLDRLVPVYTFLNKKHLSVTKTVWMFAPSHPTEFRGIEYTLEDPAYRDFALSLQARGHEIGLHGASSGNDTREKTGEGIEAFMAIFGHYPKMNTSHARNSENLYFGKNRMGNPLFRLLYSLYDNTNFEGEDEKSDYFWGDIAREKIPYHRGWFFTNLNTLAVNPSIPYHDPAKKFVPYWYSATDGWNVQQFLSRLAPKNVAALKRDRGACILYTHFGLGFFDLEKKVLNHDFVQRMQRLAQDKDLWIVPASTLLDRLVLMKNVRILKVDGKYMLRNDNPTAIAGITIEMDAKGIPGPELIVPEGATAKRLNPQVLIIDHLPASSQRGNRDLSPPPPTLLERANCVWNWLWRAVVIRL